MQKGQLQAFWDGDKEVHHVQGQKVYVRDRLRGSAEIVWDLLETGGHLYVCITRQSCVGPWTCIKG